MTVECPHCGAVAVQDMEGNEYTSHMSGCPYRRTWASPRRSARDRGTDLISDARWKLGQVDWWLLIGIVLLAVLGIVGMLVFFEWFEHWGRAGR